MEMFNHCASRRTFIYILKTQQWNEKMLSLTEVKDVKHHSPFCLFFTGVIIAL
jgi:hypothetical protein